jgi:hypothetical protein|tara:strand:- start:268 stop:396 length:129 start_codon:yes stop_codon:yes gene_type:complete
MPENELQEDDLEKDFSNKELARDRDKTMLPILRRTLEEKHKH